MRHRILVASAFALAAVAASEPRPRSANHDESKVPPYTLPDPLLFENGRPVVSADDWLRIRRPELLRRFERFVYGRFPPRPERSRWRVLAQDPEACGGLAVRRDLLFELPASDAWVPALRCTVFLPSGVSDPVPVFVGLHLFDTARPVPSPAVSRETNAPNAGIAVGSEILRRGYALASVDIGDLAPDSRERFAGGALSRLATTGLDTPEDDPPGALGAWAWGLIRMLDYFASDPVFDPQGSIAIGHSRMGKAALWAGANDPRWAAIIANGSGCGGAALSKRDFGETVAIITHAFPYWFTPRFSRFANNEAELPVDQHELLALLAPRPVYLAAAEQDSWADPRGEFLAAVHATPVFRLLGAEGIASNAWPDLDQAVGGKLRFHLRRGRHDLTAFDWHRFLAFADAEVRAPSTTRRLVATPRLDADSALRIDDAWYGSTDALRLANNVMSHQTWLGSWPKNLNTAASPFEGEPYQIQGTFDNGATVGELRFLARFHRLTGDGKARESVERGVEHVLHAQYPNGGWPQSHPPGQGYSRHITFNDDTMVHLLELLDAVRNDPDFEFLSPRLRDSARLAKDDGIDCILQCQIRVGRALTAWCAQHDSITLEPRPGRSFEPASISGAESARILRYLMTLPMPSPEVARAIRAGCDWFERSAVRGLRIVREPGDVRVVPDPAAPPVWARFYDLEKQIPIFAGRDAVIRTNLAEVEPERRAGYRWFGDWGAEVARDYARWKTANPDAP